MIKINMRSSANAIKSQGVGSCYDEQAALIKRSAGNEFLVMENALKYAHIVHYHTVNPGYYIERLLKRKKTMGIGYVHFLPNTLDKSLNLPEPLRGVFYKYLLRFYNSMDYLVTVNPYFINEIKRYGVTRPEIICIPNFVSSNLFYPLPESVNWETRKHYGIPSDKFVVLGVGQLQTRKGIADFVKTAERLPDIEFIWAGGFSFGKISEGYEDIKKIKKDHPANVKFLGIIGRDKMPALYNMADLMFLPSFDELFPMAILEALGCKKPVLVRDIPLYDSILQGYCMRGKDVDDFAAFIKKIEKDTALYDHWREKAWECHNLYTEETVLSQWIALYKNAYADLTIKKESGECNLWLRKLPQKV